MKKILPRLALGAIIAFGCAPSFAQTAEPAAPPMPISSTITIAGPMGLLPEPPGMMFPRQPTIVEINGQVDEYFAADVSSSSLYIEHSGRNAPAVDRHLKKAVDDLTAAAKSTRGISSVIVASTTGRPAKGKTKQWLAQSEVIVEGSDAEAVRRFIGESLRLAKAGGVTISATPASMHPSEASKNKSQEAVMQNVIRDIKARADIIGRELDSDYRIGAIRIHESDDRNNAMATLSFNAALEFMPKRRTLKQDFRR